MLEDLPHSRHCNCETNPAENTDGMLPCNDFTWYHDSAFWVASFILQQRLVMVHDTGDKISPVCVVEKLSCSTGVCVATTQADVL